MHILLGQRTIVILGVAAFTLAFGTAPLRAQVECGDTVGPGGTVILAADIGPCSAATGNPALRVIGPVTLDMAGHRLICNADDRPDGIRLEGKGVKLMRGSAQNCFTGLFLAGEGKHKVEDFVSEDGADEGVQVNSDKNKLSRVVANRNSDDGFDIEADKNKLEETSAYGNGDEGYEIEGEKTNLNRVSAIGNGNHGLGISGDSTKVKNCVVNGNGNDGIDVESEGNKIEKCLISRNGSGDDPGINLDNDRNQAKNNIVVDNIDQGIRIEADAGENKVQGNVVLGQDGTDLVDNNAGGTCGGNTWKKNIFGTSNADGTPGAECIQ